MKLVAIQPKYQLRTNRVWMMLIFVLNRERLKVQFQMRPAPLQAMTPLFHDESCPSDQYILARSQVIVPRNADVSSSSSTVAAHVVRTANTSELGPPEP